MREILFRGKRIGNGEWVRGDLVHVENKSYISYYYESPFSTFINEQIKYDDISIVGVAPFIEVDIATIGQYTGLNDKTGKKIFEGDICRMKADRLKGYGTIIFMGSAFVLCDKTHKQTRYYPLYPDGQFTVVGNIHDNPELLEGKS